jgi:ATP-dependent DNA helicase RecG
LVYDDEAGEGDRLGILTRTTDGFAIAEEDLRLRGPGEFAGTAQSGSDGLRFADLARDVDVYSQAKNEAEAIVRADERLTRPEHAGLRAALERQPSTRSLLLSS